MFVVLHFSSKEIRPKTGTISVLVSTWYRGSQIDAESKNLPILEPISSKTVGFGGFLIISTGAMGCGAPVEDIPRCQRFLDLEEIVSKKGTFYHFFGQKI